MLFTEYQQKYNIKLNQQQLQAILNVNGPTMLLAVPGSGKTTVIISRIGYMIHCLNVLPQNILTITFSVASAKDMKERYIKKFGSDEKVTFKTIHSLCYNIVSRYYNSKPDIINDKEMIYVLTNAYTSIKRKRPTESDLSDLIAGICLIRNGMYTQEDISKMENGKEYKDILDLYSEYKENKNVNDFDDLLIKAYNILSVSPEILESFQERYTYINVDESQDTSKIQHKIIDLLASKSRNIFMVGDEDQTIYTFRAAYPQALLRFSETYPDAKIMLLETNYRSTQNIVGAANVFIKNNGNRFNKNLNTVNPKGNDIEFTKLARYDMQYEYIYNQIKSNPSKQMCILYRNNESAIPFIDIFDKEKIPFSLKSNECSFFTHWLVTDIKNFLNLSTDIDNVELFKTVVYKMDCYIKKEQVEKAIKSTNELNCNIWTALGNLCSNSEQSFKLKTRKNQIESLYNISTYDAIQKIFEDIGYRAYMKFITNADGYYCNQDSKVYMMFSLALLNPKVNGFLNRMNWLQENMKNGFYQKQSKIYLSTIHSSKGLEFDKVILVDVYDGIFPPVMTGTKTQNTEDLESERRLFYVGITRAKKELEIIFAGRRYGKQTFKGKFIEELEKAVKTQK